MKRKKDKISQKMLNHLYRQATNWDKKSTFTPSLVVCEKVEDYVSKNKTAEELELEQMVKKELGFS